MNSRGMRITITNYGRCKKHPHGSPIDGRCGRDQLRLNCAMLIEILRESRKTRLGIAEELAYDKNPRSPWHELETGHGRFYCYTYFTI